MNNKSNQVIIVEGQSDINKLKSIYGNDIKIIKTNGLSLDKSIIDKIIILSKNHEIIIFTDPDGPGKIIREQLVQKIGTVKNAFILKEDMYFKKKKIGIAEAKEEAIKKALDNLITFNNNGDSISWQEYLDNDLFTKENRIKICTYFNWSTKISSKTLFKWLNWTEVNVEYLKTNVIKKES